METLNAAVRTLQIVRFLLSSFQDGVVIHDEEMSERWDDKYENGYKMTEGLILHARKEP